MGEIVKGTLDSVFGPEADYVEDRDDLIREGVTRFQGRESEDPFAGIDGVDRHLTGVPTQSEGTING